MVSQPSAWPASRRLGRHLLDPCHSASHIVRSRTGSSDRAAARIATSCTGHSCFPAFRTAPWCIPDLLCQTSPVEDADQRPSRACQTVGTTICPRRRLLQHAVLALPDVSWPGGKVHQCKTQLRPIRQPHHPL